MEHSQIKKEHIIEKYIAGQLEGKKKQAFEEHYEKCSKCQKELHRLVNERDFAERFVLGALSAGEAAFFEQHYFLCASCFAEVRQAEEIRLNVLDSVQRQSFPLFQTPKPAFTLTDLLTKIKDVFSSSYIAFASILLVLALLYPAWRGLHISVIPYEINKPQPLFSPGFTLQLPAETPRGRQEQIVVLKPNENLFLLNFNLPVKISRQHIYRARIFNDQNHLIWDVGRIRANGPYETFSIVCFRHSFTAGSYRLLVSEINASGKTAAVQFTFPFSLKIEK